MIIDVVIPAKAGIYHLFLNFITGDWICRMLR